MRFIFLNKIIFFKKTFEIVTFFSKKLINNQSSLPFRKLSQESLSVL